MGKPRAHVAIPRRLAELSPIGLPVQLRALPDGFGYQRPWGQSVLAPGGRIPEWFVAAVDQIVGAKFLAPAVDVDVRRNAVEHHRSSCPGVAHH